MRWFRQTVLALVTLSSCAGKAPPIPDPVEPASRADIEHSLFLVGDGGKPRAGGEPVLAALTAEIERLRAPSTVVFLGDNIYPSGLPSDDASNRREMEQRLNAQIDAVLATDARGIFVPGNHDWDNAGPDGWAAVGRQEAWIAARESDQIEQLPTGGCPGPRVIDLSPSLRVIAFDTQWWLHRYDKPGPPRCDPGTEEGVVEALRQHLAEADGRHTVVVAHHPPVSSGPHGGYFDWQDHLFPLTRAWAPLWIPLPVIGSVYPLVRAAGVSSQDQSDPANERMIAALESAFERHRPLMFAGGHEHTLEVLMGSRARYNVVSGTGYYGHTSPTKWREETLYRDPSSGFLRLDVLKDGNVRLGVLVVDAEAHVKEPFAIELSAR